MDIGKYGAFLSVCSLSSVTDICTEGYKGTLV